MKELQASQSEKRPPKRTVACYRSWWIFFFVMLVVGISGLATMLIIFTAPGHFSNGFGIIFDCDVAQSEMIVYTWKGKGHRGTSEPTKATSCTALGGGLPSYENDTAAAGPSLQPCLIVARNETIPRFHRRNTTLFVGATTGMRLLHVRNSQATDEIFASIAQTVKSFPFNFRFAKILSFTEEGAYSWTAVNYLMGKFAKSEQARNKTKTVGVLDLRNVSTQITVERVADIDSELSSKHSQRLVVYHEPYDVQSYSFICFGVAEAQRMHRASLLNAVAFERPRVVDPCMPAGNVTTILTSDIFVEPCTQRPKFAGGLAPSYEFVGGGYPTLCERTTRDLLNKSLCDLKKCSALQEESSGDFLALSSYYTTMQFFNATDTNTVSLKQLRQTIDGHCRLSWNEMKAKYTEPFVFDSCFYAYYVLSLLTSLYGFNETSWNRLRFADKVNNVRPDWTLGLMLNVTGELPPDGLVKLVSTPLFGGLMSIFSVLLLLAFIALVFAGVRCIVWESELKSARRALHVINVPIITVSTGSSISADSSDETASSGKRKSVVFGLNEVS